MKRIALPLLLLTLAAGETALAEDRALLIGIGKYRVAEELPGIDADIAMMRDVVRRLGYADSQVKVLTDSDATLEGIRRAISGWLGDTTAADRAFLYHSGHGTWDDDDDGDEADGIDEVLLPHDFREEPAGEGRTRLSNFLRDDELGRLLDDLPAGEVVVLVDSCNSGTVTRSIGRYTSKYYHYPARPGAAGPQDPSSSLVDRDRRPSIILLSASGPDEDAQASDDGALFTQGVLHAVRAAEAERHLSLEMLRRETESFIAGQVGRRKDLAHRPMLSGDPSLRSINLFLPPPPRPAEETPAGERPTAELWNELEILVRDADEVLAVAADRETYRVGEALELSVRAPGDGYLYVLNLGDGEDEITVLFPNAYPSDNRVGRGEEVRIPPRGRFRLLAELPPGARRQLNLLVAIHTARPLALAGAAAADPAEVFRVLRRGELTRSIERSSRAGNAYSAGQVVVTIER